jgi:hypothetical protein
MNTGNKLKVEGPQWPTFFFVNFIPFTAAMAYITKRLLSLFEVQCLLQLKHAETVS